MRKNNDHLVAEAHRLNLRFPGTERALQAAQKVDESQANCPHSGKDSRYREISQNWNLFRAGDRLVWCRACHKGLWVNGVPWEQFRQERGGRG